MWVWRVLVGKVSRHVGKWRPVYYLHRHHTYHSHFTSLIIIWWSSFHHKFLCNLMQTIMPLRLPSEPLCERGYVSIITFVMWCTTNWEVKQSNKHKVWITYQWLAGHMPILLFPYWKDFEVVLKGRRYAKAIKTP